MPISIAPDSQLNVKLPNLGDKPASNATDKANKTTDGATPTGPQVITSADSTKTPTTAPAVAAGMPLTDGMAAAATQLPPGFMEAVSQGMGLMNGDGSEPRGVLTTVKGQLQFKAQMDAQDRSLLKSTLAGMANGADFTKSFGGFVSNMAKKTPVCTDVNDLVMWVLRESYMAQTQDLMYFAKRVQFYNEYKKQIRAEADKARKALRDAADGKPIDFTPSDLENFEDLFYKNDPGGQKDPGDNTGGDKEKFLSPEEFLKKFGDLSASRIDELRNYINNLKPEEKKALEQYFKDSGLNLNATITATLKDKSTRTFSDGLEPIKMNASGETLDQFLERAFKTVNEAVEAKVNQGNLKEVVNVRTNYTVDLDNVQLGSHQVKSYKNFGGSDEYKNFETMTSLFSADLVKYLSGIKTSDQKKALSEYFEKNGVTIHVQVDDRDKQADNYRWDPNIKKDPKETLEAFLARAAYEAINGSRRDMEKREGHCNIHGFTVTTGLPNFLVTQDFGGGTNQGADVTAGGNRFTEGKPITDKQGLEDYIKHLEEKLNTVGDDAQLANIDLQNNLQKQQQILQMLSNMSKKAFDTAMGIIRNFV